MDIFSQLLRCMIDRVYSGNNVSVSDVENNKSSFDLPARFAKAAKLTGIRSHHCFITISKSELKMKRISADDYYTVINQHP